MSSESIDTGAIEDGVLAPGTMLGKYEIVRLLGAGGMGSVYEAKHAAIGKRVAVKTLNPSLAAVPGAKARFLREAELTTRVQHPHIVDVTDLGSEGSHAFIVMELLRGEDLGGRLTRIGMFPGPELVDIMLPVVSAVATAHEAGIIHRDLKPQNIFLDTIPGGIHPKVLDFGISKQTDGAVSAALTSTATMVGTPYYLAPEQIENNKAATAASDQYALGVIMYECLAGRRPYLGDSIFLIFNAIVNANPTPLAQLRPDLAPELITAIEIAMARDPAARFPSVRALGAALLPLATQRARFAWEGVLGTSAPGAAAAAAPYPTGGPAGFASGGISPLAPTPAPQTGGPDLRSPYPGPRHTATKALIAGRTPAPGRLGSTTPMPASRPPSLTAVDSLKPKRTGLWVTLGVAGLAAAGLLVYLALPSAPATVTTRESRRESARRERERTPESAAAPRTFRVAVRTEPSEARLELDGEPVGAGTLERELTSDGQRHRLRVSAPGYEPRELSFQDAPPPPTVILQKAAAASPPKATATADDADEKETETRGSRRRSGGSERPRHGASASTRPRAPETPTPAPEKPAKPASAGDNRSLNPNHAPLID